MTINRANQTWPEDVMSDTDYNKCRTCGEPNDDGEGYDGECGNCADKRESRREPLDEYERRQRG